LATLHSSIDHYENFPVASILVPRHLRPAISAVYWFARSADDIADEGGASAEERLAALAVYRQQLDQFAAGNALTLPGFSRLALVIRKHKLALAPFYALISAFEQDARFVAMPSAIAVENYCQRSANPVGRIVLALFGVAQDEQILAQSDAVCTSLQLINFLQDLQRDALYGRLYLPVASLFEHGFKEQEWLTMCARAQFGARSPDAIALVQQEHRRAQAYMDQGRGLINSLAKLDAGGLRLRLELAATILGGQAILDKIKANGFDPQAPRPKLNKQDWIKIAARSALSPFRF
jgi:squalene synthase HpnC